MGTMLYQSVLVPLGAGTLHALSMLASGFSVSAAFLYRNALVPLADGTCAAARMLGNALGAGAVLLYSYVLVPCASGAKLICNGAWRGTVKLASCVADAAVATYQNVLIPTGQAVAI